MNGMKISLKSYKFIQIQQPKTLNDNVKMPKKKIGDNVLTRTNFVI